MNKYAVLTRFGNYLEIYAHNQNEARDIGNCSIILDIIGGKIENGDEVHQVELIEEDPIQGIRNDLAEIMAMKS